MDLPKLMRRLGWVSFFIMWVPFVTLFIGMIGLPEGSYDWSELPFLARYSLLAVGSFFIATFALLIGSTIATAIINRSIRDKGELAEAEILQIEDTGTTINNNPVVRFYLEVRPRDRSAFQAEAEQLTSRLHLPAIQPGKILQVKYDPDTLDVALVDLDKQLANTESI